MSRTSNPHRRHFLQDAALGIAGYAAATAVGSARVGAAGANERLRVALVGCGGRGRDVAAQFASRDDVELSHVVDCHQHRLAAAATAHPQAQAVSDFRRVLDDKSVDAIINATPVHWHAPGTIVACDAGKHVYVEKPCSHNVREGRFMVEAARRNKRVVQHGTQAQSTPMIMAGIQLLHEGIIGEVLEAKAWNIQRRLGVGRGKQTTPPAALDYLKWLGPVPSVPYHDTFFSGWNWQSEFGTGEIGNDGIHDLDYARWGLGADTHPTIISAAGGRFVYDNGSPFPDTQHVYFEYAAAGTDHTKTLIYEQRLWSTNYPHNCDSGVEYYGTEGQMFLSRRGKLQVLLDGNQRHPVDVPLEPHDTKSHIANFIASIRSDSLPSADAKIAHLTASVCHLGNIATRLRRTLHFDPQNEVFVGDKEANDLLTRTYRAGHWAAPTEA